MRSLIIAVDASPFADVACSWLPDLAATGVRRVTLFHAIEGTGAECVRELDALRPRLDRLAVQLSALSVETDIALKRGDRVKWLVSLAALQTSDLLVLGPRCSQVPPTGPIGSTLAVLLEESEVPLLVLGAQRRPADPSLFGRPVLVSGGQATVVEARARRIFPAAPRFPTVPAGEPIPRTATLAVTGPEPDTDTPADLLALAHCPVLIFPAPSLAARGEAGAGHENPPTGGAGRGTATRSGPTLR